MTLHFATPRSYVQSGFALASLAVVWLGLFGHDLSDGTHVAYTHSLTVLCVTAIALKLILWRGPGHVTPRWVSNLTWAAMGVALVEFLSNLLLGAPALSGVINRAVPEASWARGQMGLDTAVVCFVTMVSLKFQRRRPMLLMVALATSCWILIVTGLGKWTGLPMFGGNMGHMTLVSLALLQAGIVAMMARKAPFRILTSDSSTGRNVRFVSFGGLIAISVALMASYMTGQVSGYFDARDLSVTMVALSALSAVQFVLLFWFGAAALRAELLAERDRRRIRRQRDRDYLTGIYNRRAGNRIIEERISGALAEGRSLAIALLDIDHFKLVNDTLGHQAGDRALIQVARILKSQIREQDTLVRWGGEEFLICMASRPGVSLLSLADGLRAKLAEMPLTVGGSPGVARITVSVGLAEVGPDDPSLVRAVDRADRALLRAKGDGRNRVVTAPVQAKRQVEEVV